MTRLPPGEAAAAGNPVIADGELKARIIDFVRTASIEVTPGDKVQPASLTGHLAAGSTLYVAHTPHVAVADVVDTAVALRSAGFAASPHIVARRIGSRAELESALGRLKDAGISRVLLVAGDLPHPVGPYSSSLDILDSGTLAAAGIDTIGIAGHPEGHNRIDAAILWDALRRKQEYAVRTGARVHIVSQFGFNPAALVDWERGLAEHGISLPVEVGMAGPATLKSLMKYAMLCGIVSSLGALMTNPGAAATLRTLVTSADEMLPRIVRERTDALARRFVRPHFFPFGGLLRTVGWLEAIRAGRFDVDAAAGKLVVRP